MRFDWILNDLFRWVGQLAWWRDQKIKKRPYEKLEKWHLSGLGILSRVARPPELCPRDVGTYIFEPFRYGRTTMRDLHICCDHLEGMSQPRTVQARRIFTHRITVLIADHWIGADGRYDAEELFSLDDDLQGQSSRRDVHIPCILHQIAIAVAGAAAMQDLTTFDFLREVDNAKRYCMRSDYTHTLRLPKPTGTVIANPVDGDRPVRIRLD